MTTSIVARAAAFAAALTLLIVVGCVSTPTGPGHPAFEQKGEITIKSGEEKDIFFTTPYVKAPSIEVKDDNFNDVKIVDCKADHFRVRNDTFQIHYVSWTANGERSTTAVAPVPATPTSTVPPPITPVSVPAAMK